MSLTKVLISNRQNLGAIENYQTVYSGDVNPIIDKVNNLSSTDGVINASVSVNTPAITVNTIVEKTTGSGVTITGERKTATINTATATVTLTTAQSGNTFFLSKADGIAYTLPAASTVNIGVIYKFKVITSVTSNTYSITGASSADLFKGFVMTEKSGASASAVPNGSSNYILSMAGTTTGGLIGTELEIICTALNTWVISGRYVYSGTLGTVFTG